MTEQIQFKKPHFILIIGMAGSGKSTAIDILEDLGFNHIENLPVQLLPQLIELYNSQPSKSALVISINTTNSVELNLLNNTIANYHENIITPVFLTANKPTLVRRFAETRRRHPLSQSDKVGLSTALNEAIDKEIELFSDIKEISYTIDTSNMQSSQLRKYLIQLLKIEQGNKIILTFQSFAFKRGVPIDTDFLFDARSLPNPHYISQLKPLTGRDQEVIDFFKQADDVAEFEQDINNFLQKWLVKFCDTQRSYVSIAIGCTGGQHRSVYLVEQLAKRFNNQYQIIVRHREQDKNN